MAKGGSKAARRGYSIIFEQKFNQKRPQDEARLPGEDIALYLHRNSIREQPQAEARQPGQVIALYLIRKEMATGGGKQ